MTVAPVDDCAQHILGDFEKLLEQVEAGGQPALLPLLQLLQPRAKHDEYRAVFVAPVPWPVAAPGRYGVSGDYGLAGPHAGSPSSPGWFVRRVALVPSAFIT